MNVSPKKILLVHVDKQERGSLAIMLARFGHSVSFADGRMVDNLTLNEYDLIVVDEDPADEAGIVLLKHLSAKVRAKTIFLSSGGNEVRSLCQGSLGVFECMKKPVKPIDLAVVACDFFVSDFLTEEALLSC